MRWTCKDGNMSKYTRAEKGSIIKYENIHEGVPKNQKCQLEFWGSNMS